MSAIITQERPDHPDAVLLVTELQTYLESIYPPENRHGFSIERLVAEGVAFFVLRVDGEPAGCGGIKLFGSGFGENEFDELEFGELKRMYVRPQFRGRQFGKLILDRQADHARENGINLLRVETGIHQQAAIRLYEKNGFHRIPPFGPYVNSALSLCFEKQIDAQPS